MNTVFVYGTLKRDFGNHRVMIEAGGRFVGEDRIPAGMFSMLDLGHFPALIGGDGCEISGEVFEVDNMQPLDRLEGFPRFYNRRIVETENGRDVWVYFLEENHRERDCEVVASGTWESRR